MLCYDIPLVFQLRLINAGMELGGASEPASLVGTALNQSALVVYVMANLAFVSCLENTTSF